MPVGSLVNAYDFFSNATEEAINTNPDNLQTVSVDPSGETGLLTLEPNLGTNPGIYELGITATNDTDSSKPAVLANNTFVVNVLPSGQPDNPTIVDFAMNGLTTQTASIPMLGAHNGITNGSTQNLQLLLPNGGNPAGEGITVNSITPVITGTDTATIQANLTVDSTLVANNTSTVTDSNGTAHSNGILLEFTASPLANGYPLTPYTEMVYIIPQ